MEWFSLLVFWSIIILLPALILFYHRRKSHSSRLPPGPPRWPFFGNMFDLGTTPHRALAGLEKQYGPVVWLKFGSVNSVVVQTAKAAAELFKNHDLSFADRIINDTMRSHDIFKSSLVLSPYGSYCRVLRRICTEEMLVNKRMNETAAIRQKCMDNMVHWIQKEERELKGARGIHVAWFVFLTSFNLLGNLMLSRDLVDPESKAGSEFFTALMGLLESDGHANISDVFPWLRWFDLQGLRKKADRDTKKILDITSEFVKERVQQKQQQQQGPERTKDFLDVLLEFEGSGKDEPPKLLERTINIFIPELFMTSAEPTSSTTEWALAELLRNPEKMIKVKAELTKVIGPDRKFEERDVDNLHYLQAVVKETLRLHPPVPLLIPRKATQDTEFMEYRIPKNTQLLVNVWAIGRDPQCWDDPLSFKPERFLGSNVDYKGQHYELLPFGSGRRMCPFIPLGHKLLHLLLGSLLHEFDWELAGQVSPQTMDMSEKIGKVVRKFEPLQVIPKKVRM